MSQIIRIGIIIGGHRIFIFAAVVNIPVWGWFQTARNGTMSFPDWKNTGRQRRSAGAGIRSIRIESHCAYLQSTVTAVKTDSRKLQQKRTSDGVESVFARENPTITASSRIASSPSGRKKYASEQESAIGRVIRCTAGLGRDCL